MAAPAKSIGVCRFCVRSRPKFVVVAAKPSRVKHNFSVYFVLFSKLYFGVPFVKVYLKGVDVAFIAS